MHFDRVVGLGVNVSEDRVAIRCCYVSQMCITSVCRSWYMLKGLRSRFSKARDTILRPTKNQNSFRRDSNLGSSDPQSDALTVRPLE